MRDYLVIYYPGGPESQKFIYTRAENVRAVYRALPRGFRRRGGVIPQRLKTKSLAELTRWGRRLKI